jgi:hypothetical protein
MELFVLITKWFWAICIITTFINVAIYRSRASRQIQAHPELEEGYRALIKGFAIWGSLPWVVMGVGCVFGGVPSVFYFFRPRDGNPFVLAFIASVFLEWVLGTYWLIFRGGAQMLVKHPGMFNWNLKTPRMVIFFWFLSLAGGIFAVVMMFSKDFPLPPR